MSKTDLPTIRIKDAWLFRDNVSVPLNELWGRGEPLRSDGEYEAIAKAYQNAWKPYEQKILKGMTKLIGLTFRQNIIDVYIAPWISAFSDPMVIGVMQKPDEFVDTLTHELIHRLLTDNTAVPHELNLLPVWEELFGKRKQINSTIHIPVHAIHKAIYLEILKEPNRLDRDIDQSKQYPDYLNSWDYVNETGYKNITEQLKRSYEKLALTNRHYAN